MSEIRTLWDNRRHNEVTWLNSLIPTEGAMPGGGPMNRKLELYRLFSNVYYDVYNNGCANWDIGLEAEYATVANAFGEPPLTFQDIMGDEEDPYFQPGTLELLERLGDKVIDAALEEQKL